MGLFIPELNGSRFWSTICGVNRGGVTSWAGSLWTSATPTKTGINLSVVSNFSITCHDTVVIDTRKANLFSSRLVLIILIFVLDFCHYDFSRLKLLKFSMIIHFGVCEIISYKKVLMKSFRRETTIAQYLSNQGHHGVEKQALIL